MAYPLNYMMLNSNALFLGDAEYCILNEQIIAVSEESLGSAMDSKITNFLTATSSDGETWNVPPIILLDMK